MARPQVEDGHTKIANELVDALSRTYFSPAESKIFWTILRRTYGWNKKMDKISYSQIESATGLDRRHISPALKRLVKRNIILCNNAGERIISEYGIQKDYDKWVLTPIQVTTDTTLSNKSVTDTSDNLLLKQVAEDKNNLTPITIPSVTTLGQSDTQKGDKSVTDLSNHKRHNTITKDIIQKTRYGEFQNVLLSDDEYKKLCERFSKDWTDGYIEQLSGYMQQSKKNEKKYTDHYATLRNWLLRDGKTNGTYQGNLGTPKLNRTEQLRASKGRPLG